MIQSQVEQYFFSTEQFIYCVSICVVGNNFSINLLYTQFVELLIVFFLAISEIFSFIATLRILYCNAFFHDDCSALIHMKTL